MTEPYGHAVSRPPVVAVEATERAILLAKLAKKHRCMLLT